MNLNWNDMVTVHFFSREFIRVCISISEYHEQKAYVKVLFHFFCHIESIAYFMIYVEVLDIFSHEIVRHV